MLTEMKMYQLTGHHRHQVINYVMVPTRYFIGVQN